MAQIVLGTNGFTEQPIRRKYVDGQGWTTVRTFQGPRDLGDAKAEELITTLEPSDLDIVYGTPAEISVTVPDPGGQAQNLNDSEERAIVWNLRPVFVERALSSHGYFNESSSYAQTMQIIDDAIEHGEGESVRASIAAVQNMVDYLDLRLRGVEAFTTYTWMMVCSIVTRKTGDLKSSMTNVGKVVSYSEAVGSTPVNPNSTPISTSGIHWERPTIRHYCNWEEAGVYGEGWQDIPVNDWLKQPPDVQESRQNGRRVITLTQEYHGAVSFSKVLYNRTAAAGTGFVVGIAGRSTGGKRR